MTRTSRTRLLEESLQVLVTHFGSQQVRAALARVAPDDDGNSGGSVTSHDPQQRSARPRVAQRLEGLRQAEPERHRMLDTFLSDLRDRRVLATPDDIRHFANAIGLKEISGRSRREMIPGLIDFLVLCRSQDLGTRWRARPASRKNPGSEAIPCSRTSC